MFGKKRGSASIKSASTRASYRERRKAIGPNLSFEASEAYKLLRTNLVYSMADVEGCKIIGVTSALRGEGKSITSLNLAYCIAESGKKVLLLEADMRLPICAEVLQLDKQPGLSEVLIGANTLNDSVRQSILLDQLSVLPAGQVPPNPAELLSSGRMKKVLEMLSKVFEYIIVDLPPVNAVSDGLTVAQSLSGMLMVVRREYCDQAVLAEAMRRMEILKVKILGFVLNDAQSAEQRYKRYGRYYGKENKYGYGYGYSNNTDLRQ